MFDWLFAFFHLGLLLAVIGYGIYSLVFLGNVRRFLFIIFFLAVYYVLVLHKAVRKEIARKRSRRAKE